jgi:hypothetical protein
MALYNEALPEFQARTSSCPGQTGIGQGSQSAKSGVRPMAKDKAKTKTAIYHPPKKDMPYMVVTVSPEGVTATAVASKDEARTLASKKTLRVLIEDNGENSEVAKSKDASGSAQGR